MFSLIYNSSDWGILISVSEIILVILGLLLLINGTSAKGFRRFFYLCLLPVLFGCLGYFNFVVYSVPNPFSPLFLGFYALLPPAMIYIFFHLVQKTG